MKASILAGTTAIALLMALPAQAGPNEAPQSIQTEKEESQAVLSQRMDEAGQKALNGAPNDRTGSGFHASSLQFTSTQGEADLSLAASFSLGESRPEKSNNAGSNFYTVRSTRLGLVATVPIEKDATVQRLFSGDSLVTGSKLKLSVTRFSASIGLGTAPENDKARQTQANAYQACISDFRSLNSPMTPDAAATIDNTEQAIRRFSLSEASDGDIAGYDEIFDALKRGDTNSQKLASFCYPDKDNTNGMRNTGSLLKKYARDEYRAFRANYIKNNARLTFMGLDASMGRDDHSFLDRTNFKLLSEPRTTWEVGAYYGWIGSDLSWSLRARAVYGQTYKDNDEAEICRSVSIPVGGTDCIKGPDGAPIRERTGLASVEARKLVTVNDKTQIALAPQVTYRFEDKNVGVEVPIYLVPDEKGKLSGGIKAVYNSKGDEFAVGLFVGVPFSVFYDSK